MIKILISAIIAVLIAHLIKLLSKFIKTKKFDINQFFKAGGMPSAHSAIVSALALSLYLYEGITSLFIVTLVFSIIVIRDTILRPKEVRHKPSEVLAGIIIGLIIAFIISII